MTTEIVNAVSNFLLSTVHNGVAGGGINIMVIAFHIPVTDNQV